MSVIESMEIQLRSARDTLERIHVLGAESGMMDGAIQAISNVLRTFERIKSEVKHDGDGDGKRDDASDQVDRGCEQG